MSDAAEDSLVLLAVGGSRAAFESLVRRCARGVYAELLLQCRDPHLAEDLTQETFLRAWRAVGTLDDPGKFRPWLAAIARTALYDGHKSATRLKRGGAAKPATLSEEGPAMAAVDPADGAARNEEQKRAMDALEALPERYRRPLALRFLHDADYAEICTQLGLTNGSLRGLLTRGLEMLRDAMNRPSSAPPSRRPT